LSIMTPKNLISLTISSSNISILIWTFVFIFLLPNKTCDRCRSHQTLVDHVSSQSVLGHLIEPETYSTVQKQRLACNI